MQGEVQTSPSFLGCLNLRGQCHQLVVELQKEAFSKRQRSAAMPSSMLRERGCLFAAAGENMAEQNG